jgi:predicted nucleic-acid-binding protein
MIGIDTNVFLRFLTADDANQHKIALSFFKQRSSESPAFISTVTLVETVWVLHRSYGFTHEEIRFALSQVLDSDDFVVEAREGVEFLRHQGANPMQLADYLVAHLCAKAGCKSIVTFDRSAAKTVAGMELLK